MKVNILGIYIDNVSYKEAFDRLQQFLADGKNHYIVTPNPEMIVIAQKDEEFRNIINAADLAIPDGIGLVWAAKILGINFHSRVSGTDLAEKICEMAGRKGRRIFLLGGKEGVAVVAKECLERKYPGLVVAGTDDGGSDEQSDARIREIINQSGAIDFLFVAFGAPFQEKWIARNRDKIDVKVAMGVGGALDYFSGLKKRAPAWMRSLGLEWLFRLFVEPWRIKRQLRLPLFLLLVLREKMRQHLTA